MNFIPRFFKSSTLLWKIGDTRIYIYIYIYIFIWNIKNRVVGYLFVNIHKSNLFNA